MVDPTTINTSMFVPVRGSDVGTWDVPINSNFNTIDAMLGTVTNISPTNLPITLTTGQSQVGIIRLNGTLTGNVAITMAGIYKGWTIENNLTNSPSGFVVTLVSTTGAQQIGVPPGSNDVYYDGVSLSVKYRNLRHNIGDYWDYAGSAVPSWVTACTIPPYLNCDGTAFSSATYPTLCNLFGGTGFNILPDARGRNRFAMNQTTGRITAAGGGIDGNTLFATGGAQTNTLITGNLPPYTPTGSVATTINGQAAVMFQAAVNGFPAGVGFAFSVNPGMTATSIFAGNAQGGTSTPITNLSPGYVGGLTMIRAGG